MVSARLDITVYHPMTSDTSIGPLQFNVRCASRRNLDRNPATRFDASDWVLVTCNVYHYILYGRHARVSDSNGYTL